MKASSGRLDVYGGNGIPTESIPRPGAACGTGQGREAQLLRRNWSVGDHQAWLISVLTSGLVWGQGSGGCYRNMRKSFEKILKVDSSSGLDRFIQ